MSASLTPEQIARAHAMRCEGASYCRISDVLGVPISRVTQRMNRVLTCAVCRGRFRTALETQVCRHCRPIWSACHASPGEAATRLIGRLGGREVLMALGYARRAGLAGAVRAALSARLQELGGAR